MRYQRSSVGLGMMAHKLYNGGARSIMEGATRLLNGQGTASDYRGLGTLVGVVGSLGKAGAQFKQGFGEGVRVGEGVRTALSRANVAEVIVPEVGIINRSIGKSELPPI
jgi:hypothetical protein